MKISIDVSYAPCHVGINGCCGIFNKVIDGALCCNECEQPLHKVWDLFEIATNTLKEISGFQGKTLLGEHCNGDKELDKQHQIGANKAFSECADLAISVFDQLNGN